jgi:hypothetical protein
MKKQFLKYYTIVIFLCSTLVMFAQPGDNDTGGTINDGDAPGAPIDDYIWVMALVGLFFVFMKFRAMQKNRIKG